MLGEPVDASLAGGVLSEFAVNPGALSSFLGCTGVVFRQLLSSAGLISESQRGRLVAAGPMASDRVWFSTVLFDASFRSPAGVASTPLGDRFKKLSRNVRLAGGAAGGVGA